ncbi:uncharacterized protein KD926_001399 [Aspergillus affinis]|uniref:uncharacterized protein n=1 Tax=Aspergillus affinis TaxID=1070780 RepID=UPI0022FE1D2A|nr:uncharacterized protein KD926_001399 [Aspergillus affinis]KAI9036705.1 hypothetical protein KD926_001399 [Aspergillus affinis]
MTYPHHSTHSLQPLDVGMQDDQLAKQADIQLQNDFSIAQQGKKRALSTLKVKKSKDIIPVDTEVVGITTTAPPLAWYDKVPFSQQQITQSTMRLSTDESFHFELLRLLAHSSYGGADVGETLTMSSEITLGDFESSPVFNKRADRIVEQRKKMTNDISIRDAMFRATTYYRAADFYIHGN